MWYSGTMKYESFIARGKSKKHLKKMLSRRTNGGYFVFACDGINDLIDGLVDDDKYPNLFIINTKKNDRNQWKILKVIPVL